MSTAEEHNGANPSSPMQPVLPDGDADGFVSYGKILHYSLPLILSHAAGVVLQFTDRMFLSWHAPESVAGAGMAGLIAICFISFAAVTTSFTGVFAAQYLGAGQPGRLGAIVWQGGYISLALGLCAFMLSFAAQPLFNWIGHGPAVQAAEIDYFQPLMQGGVAFMLTGALMGFFIGRGETRVVMLTQIGGVVINGFLDYAMIFGKFGFPAWGVVGAGWASIVSQFFVFLFGLCFFWQRRHRQQFDTWSGRRFEWRLCRRILRFGVPSGLRDIVELVMWSVFLAFIGLLGDNELAVSNVAFIISTLAWQPMIGVSLAVAMLVGRGQGAERPELSRLAMWRGFLLAQGWELFAAALFIAFPDFFLGFFFDAGTPGYETLMAEGRILLWFVAAYCLVDGVNVVFAQGLIGAGDSWWTSKITLVLSALAVAAMGILAWSGAGLHAYWVVATLYVAASGTAWLWRYRSGHWESMKVVETVVI